MHLNFRIIIKMLGTIVLILGIAMIPALITAQIYQEPAVTRAFAVCSPVLILVGFITLKIARPASTAFRIREGYLTVSLCWLAASLLGAIPYMTSGVVPSFVDAFFESTSGFTTSGCTVLNVEIIPKGLTMWKAISHWLGGMGILVFIISLLPLMGIGGQTLVRAEAPGPTLDKASSRISDSAKILYLIYLSLSVVEFVLLSFSSMSTYDALINTFGSISTSGLASHESGIAHFNSLYVEVVMIAFMFLSSINFVLYSQAVRGKWRDFFRNVELRAFCWILGVSTLLVSLALYMSGVYDTFGEALRYGGFQVIAFGTTSGYALSDFTVWPTFCKFILFMLMFIGGCAASTSGALKIIRLLVLLKLIKRGFLRRIHPHSVVSVKLGGKPVSSETVSSITGFILAYFAVFIFSSLVLSLQNLDFTTTISTAVCMLSSTGACLGMMGAESNFSMYSEPLRLFMSFLMIVGRLEIFTIIVLFMPRFWNPDR